MGLFKSEEQKAYEEKMRLNKLREVVNQYGIKYLTDEELKMAQAVVNMEGDNTHDNFFSYLSGRDHLDYLRISNRYEAALVKQNWIIISQLSRLNYNLKVLYNKAHGGESDE